jgi:hypothetical protein
MSVLFALYEIHKSDIVNFIVQLIAVIYNTSIKLIIKLLPHIDIFVRNILITFNSVIDKTSIDHVTR